MVCNKLINGIVKSKVPHRENLVVEEILLYETMKNRHRTEVTPNTIIHIRKCFDI